MTKIVKDRFIKIIKAINGTPRNERKSTSWEPLNGYNGVLMKYTAERDEIQINISGGYRVVSPLEETYYDATDEYITIFGRGFVITFELEYEKGDEKRMNTDAEYPLSFFEAMRAANEGYEVRNNYFLLEKCRYTMKEGVLYMGYVTQAPSVVRLDGEEITAKWKVIGKAKN